jgi:hypothetical protein
MPGGHWGLGLRSKKLNIDSKYLRIYTQIYVIKKFFNAKLMLHIIFDDQNIAKKYATSNTKEPKNLKTHNKLRINAIKGKEKTFGGH